MCYSKKGGGNPLRGFKMSYSDDRQGEKAKEGSKRRLEYFRQYYKRHAEQKRAYQAEYRKQHAEQLRTKQRAYDRKRQNKRRAYFRQYFRLHRTEQNARSLAYSHVSLGKSCTRCGSTENLERHHPDYSQPLNIVTLCPQCHVNTHIENRKLY